VTEIQKSIYSTAQNLFALHGFAGVSISDIATQAKIAKSTVLHHFPTKEKLYQAVMKQSLEQFANLGATLGSARTSELAVGTKLKMLFRWMVNEPIHAKLLNRIFMDNPKAAHLAAKKYWIPLIKNFLDSAPPAGKVSAEKLRLFILFVVNAIFQLAFSVELQILLLDEAITKDELLNRYEQLIDKLIEDYFAS